MSKRCVMIAMTAVLAAVGFGALAQDRNAGLFQYSTINALLQGFYEGDLSVGSLTEHGDFGLGTFNRLDGEMVVLDGVVYQVRSDGRARVAAPGTKTPFAEVIRFSADHGAALPASLDYAGLKRHLDTLTDIRDIFYAIRIDGTFDGLKVRSVPPQSRPYRPLARVIDDQVVFDLETADGTLVGLWMPAYMSGIGIPGYHFHFLTEDRERGGHLLGLTTGTGTIAIDRIDSFSVRLPGGDEFADLDLSGARTGELGKVETTKEAPVR